MNNFQYPQSDRAHCNPSDSTPKILVIILSVSSVGSSPLQPYGRGGVRSDGAPFSILSRIEPTATAGRRIWHEGAGVFQYPQSDRAHCNPRTLIASPAT